MLRSACCFYPIPYKSIALYPDTAQLIHWPPKASELPAVNWMCAANPDRGKSASALSIAPKCRSGGVHVRRMQRLGVALKPQNIVLKVGKETKPGIYWLKTKSGIYWLNCIRLSVRCLE